MEIQLKPELEQFLQEKLKSGAYQTLDEAINQGIELLKHQEEVYQGRFDELQEKIMVGVQASEKGEVIDENVLFEYLKTKLEARQSQSKSAALLNKEDLEQVLRLLEDLEDAEEMSLLREVDEEEIPWDEAKRKLGLNI
jgi:antitoxin ParD1/3/4